MVMSHPKLIQGNLSNKLLVELFFKQSSTPKYYNIIHGGEFSSFGNILVQFEYKFSYTKLNIVLLNVTLISDRAKLHDYA